METLLEGEIVSDRKKWSLIKFIILMVGRYLDSSRIQVRYYRQNIHLVMRYFDGEKCQGDCGILLVQFI